MPIIAIDKKYETIFLGPFKSKRYPKGICTLANPKKYPPPKRPNSPADKSNSLINSGEIVAVIALSNVEIKYPKANTKKIEIALVCLRIGLFIIW